VSSIPKPHASNAVHPNTPSITIKVLLNLRFIFLNAIKIESGIFLKKLILDKNDNFIFTALSPRKLSAGTFLTES